MENVLQGFTPETLTLENVPKAVAHLLNEVGEMKRLLQQKTEAPNETDQWFDLDGLETYLPEKLARATLYGKLSNGEIPGHKRGKKWYFLKSEIDNYLKQGRRKTLAETEAEADKYLRTKKGLTNGK